MLGSCRVIESLLTKSLPVVMSVGQAILPSTFCMLMLLSQVRAGLRIIV